MGQKRFDLGLADLHRMSPAMEDDETTYPFCICSFGAAAIVPRPQLFAHLVKQAQCGQGRNRQIRMGMRIGYG
jgi:hypothetical protein